MDILSNSTIVTDEKFISLLKELESMSFLSSRETIEHYSNNKKMLLPHGSSPRKYVV